MKILVLHGSMRKGNTYSLVKEMISRLQLKSNVTVQEISIADLNLPFCRSCHMCLSRGEEFCPDYNIMREIQAALLDCDGVIVSGVTYAWALNAAMKNVVDHLAYGFHRPAFFEKKGVVVTTATGVGEKDVAKYLKSVLGQWGINKAILVTQNEKEQRLLSSAQLATKLDRATAKFYRQISTRQMLPPSIKSIAVHNAFRAMSLSEFSESERDRQYWRQKKHNKAYPVKAGMLKYALGAIVFAVSKSMTKWIGLLYEKRIKR